MIKNKINDLCKELKTDVRYEYVLSMDRPCATYSSTSERFVITAQGYEPMYLPSRKQVLDIDVNDFVRIEVA